MSLGLKPSGVSAPALSEAVGFWPQLNDGRFTIDRTFVRFLEETSRCSLSSPASGNKTIPDVRLAITRNTPSQFESSSSHAVRPWDATMSPATSAPSASPSKDVGSRTSARRPSRWLTFPSPVTSSPTTWVNANASGTGGRPVPNATVGVTAAWLPPRRHLAQLEATVDRSRIHVRQAARIVVLRAVESRPTKTDRRA